MSPSRCGRVAAVARRGMPHRRAAIQIALLAIAGLGSGPGLLRRAPTGFAGRPAPRHDELMRHCERSEAIQGRVRTASPARTILLQDRA